MKYSVSKIWLPGRPAPAASALIEWGQITAQSQMRLMSYEAGNYFPPQKQDGRDCEMAGLWLGHSISVNTGGNGAAGWGNTAGQGVT